MPGLSTFIAFIAKHTGLSGAAASVAAKIAIGVMALILISIIGPTACNMIEGRIIKSKVNEANAEFTDDLNQSTGKQDGLSDKRKQEIYLKTKKTEDLIDEALEKNCDVADYIISNGAKCVRVNGGPVPGP